MLTFITLMKKRKNLVINVTKDEQDFYTENNKILLRKRNLKIKLKIEVSGKIYHDCG